MSEINYVPDDPWAFLTGMSMITMGKAMEYHKTRSVLRTPEISELATDRKEELCAAVMAREKGVQI